MDYVLSEALTERLWAAVPFAVNWSGPTDSEAAADAVLSLAYLDEDGRRIGEVRPIALAPSFTEAFRMDGTIGAAGAAAPLHLPDPPLQGRAVQFLRGDEVVWQVALAAVERKTNPMPAVTPRLFGPASAGFQFPVFSERFIDEERFYRHVDDLYRFIRSVPPFAELAERWALRAYYWRAPNVTGGWFDTFDRPYNCSATTTQTLYGDREKARSRLVHLMLRAKFGLILIDSAVRGGAGGLEDWQYPAWSTITPCRGPDGVPVERWEAVALHEIGHALGLCDEYLLAERAGEPSRNEPNVSAHRNAAEAGWRLPVNRPGDPTHGAGEPAEDRDAVGTYRGCRYRDDLYRSGPQCMMRSTTTHYFCEVCSDHIDRKLA